MRRNLPTTPQKILQEDPKSAVFRDVIMTSRVIFHLYPTLSFLLEYRILIIPVNGDFFPE